MTKISYHDKMSIVDVLKQLELGQPVSFFLVPSGRLEALYFERLIESEDAGYLLIGNNHNAQYVIPTNMISGLILREKSE